MSLSVATDLLKLLGDPTRVRLVALLMQDELTVAELVKVTRLTQSRVSTHLGKLKEAGLVFDRRAGTFSYYRASERSMPDDARELWQLVAHTARDALLDQDTHRLREVLRERQGERKWADNVAGRMERHYSPGRTWESALRGLLGLLRLGEVLDIASGDCALAELLAPRARRVTCVDNSAAVLRAGQARLARLPHVTFARGDLHALPFADGSFDHVLLMASLCYASDPGTALAEAGRVLRPGGTLVAATLARHEHREQVAPYDHVQCGFLPQELKDMLEAAGLQVDLCQVTSRERRLPHFEVITVHAHQ